MVDEDKKVIHVAGKLGGVPTMVDELPQLPPIVAATPKKKTKPKLADKGVAGGNPHKEKLAPGEFITLDPTKGGQPFFAAEPGGTTEVPPPDKPKDGTPPYPVTVLPDKGPHTKPDKAIQDGDADTPKYSWAEDDAQGESPNKTQKRVICLKLVPDGVNVRLIACNEAGGKYPAGNLMTFRPDGRFERFSGVGYELGFDLSEGDRRLQEAPSKEDEYEGEYE